MKILTQGGPGNPQNLIVYSIYRDAFFNYRFGSAAAQSVILFAIIMVMTLMILRQKERSQLLMEQTMTIKGRKRVSREEIIKVQEKANRKAMTVRRVRTGALIAANVLVSLFVLLPLLYAVSVAFMPPGELFTTEMNLVPRQPTWGQFQAGPGKNTAGAVCVQLLYHSRADYSGTDYFLFFGCIFLLLPGV